MLIKGRAKDFLRARKINRSRGSRVSDDREVDTSAGDTSVQYLCSAPVLRRGSGESRRTDHRSISVGPQQRPVTDGKWGSGRTGENLCV